MRGEPVIIFNRYTSSLEEEAIFGERALRWTCESLPGRALNWLMLSRKAVSRIFGWYMNRSSSARRIEPFIETYGLDPNEFQREVRDFRSFNDFFRRELKPDARPVDPKPDTVIFPADGRHLAFENLGSEDRIFAKGQHWDLLSLFGGQEALVERFKGGTLVLSRLCPTDYHHFHYPVGGIAGEAQAFKGSLFSVNPISLRRRVEALWQNYRCLSLIRSGHGDLVAFIEIGATNVGSIHHRPLPTNSRVEKGAYKGWFEFGGSSVVTVFEAGRIRLCADLAEQSARGIELYARMGDRMGTTLQ